MQKFGNLFSSVIAFLWGLLPWSVNVILAYALATLWVDILRIRRRVILQNISTAFPDMSEKEKLKIAKASMVALCRSFFDVMKVPSLTDDWIKKNVIFENAEIYEKIRKSGTGFLALTLHMGSGDLGAAVISRSQVPLSLISKRFTNKFLDSFWFGLRERSQTEFIDAHSKNNAFEILGALKRKKGVVFVLDQFMGKPYGVETEFFGVTTGTAYGLALFAKKTHKPVYPLYTYWGEDKKLHICIEDSIDLQSELSETNEVVTNRFNRELERIISLCPQQWMWIHKRWKTFE